MKGVSTTVKWYRFLDERIASIEEKTPVARRVIRENLDVILTACGHWYYH